MTIAADYKIMGIINVTPDSFSDGGSFNTKTAAVNQARQLIDDGADILDIGGESTRPYASQVSLGEELSRVIPIIEEIRSFSDITISIDTIKAEVARRAIEAGADIINDISALKHDPDMIAVVRENDNIDLIIMHMQGVPGNMQDNPHYKDVVAEISAFLKERLEMIASSGIDLKRVIIDPGIGFGKNCDHNLSIIKHIDQFSALGQRILLGHSRKRFLGDITGLDTAAERDTVTAFVSGFCLHKDVSIFRVHDVASTRQTLQVAQVIAQAH